jgi:hypothetical protein
MARSYGYGTASRVAVQEGKAYGMYIDGPEDHADCWQMWKRCLPTFFHNSGPKDWPRGRVLFNIAVKHFEVDVCRQLLTPQRETEIMEYFSLPKASTIFHADPHYAESRFLLGREGPREHAASCARDGLEGAAHCASGQMALSVRP